MIKLVLIRHGESEWNKKNLLQDGPMLILLNREWKKQKQAENFLKKAAMNLI